MVHFYIRYNLIVFVGDLFFFFHLALLSLRSLTLLASTKPERERQGERDRITSHVENEPFVFCFIPKNDRKNNEKSENHEEIRNSLPVIYGPTVYLHN